MTGKAYVLMTAMPPTKGHMQLIEFASKVGQTAEIIVTTQPGEPFEYERVQALQDAARRYRLDNVYVHHLRALLPQEPEQAVGFWDMWAGFLIQYGLRAGDFIVASEMYGQKLAEVTGATFVPYDLSRTIYHSKATIARQFPIEQFDRVLPEFQKHMRLTVTVFGAESCGKTTLTNRLRTLLPSYALPEWARPYLEAVGPEPLTREKMEMIHLGQAALQESTDTLVDKPFIIQDTDLFSTVGYWQLHNHDFGTVPQNLVDDARALQSDLYIVTPSNIPFEQDPLRYGGHQREGSDEFWLALAEEFGLNVRVLTETDPARRAAEAATIIESEYHRLINLHYKRVTAESLRSERGER